MPLLGLRAGGVYWQDFTASNTFFRVSSLTPFFPFSTMEMVAGETPICLASSLTVI